MLLAYNPDILEVIKRKLRELALAGVPSEHEFRRDRCLSLYLENLCSVILKGDPIKPTDWAFLYDLFKTRQGEDAQVDSCLPELKLAMTEMNGSELYLLYLDDYEAAVLHSRVLEEYSNLQDEMTDCPDPTTIVESDILYQIEGKLYDLIYLDEGVLFLDQSELLDLRDLTAKYADSIDDLTAKTASNDLTSEEEVLVFLKTYLDIEVKGSEGLSN